MNAQVIEALYHGWEWAWQTSLQSSLLLVWILVLHWTLGARLSTWLAGTIWGFTALRLLLPQAPSSPWSLYNLFGSQPVGTDTSQAPVATGAVFASEQINLISHPTAYAQPGPELWLALIWIAGAAILLSRGLLQSLAMERWAVSLPVVADARIRTLFRDATQKTNLSSPPTLLLGSPGSPVAVCGWWRAQWLIVPIDLRQRFDEDQIRGIFLHELEHARRGDLFWNWVLLLIQSVHWFNPLVWIAARCYDTQREWACDAAALDSLSPRDRKRYGEALLRAAEAQLPTPSFPELAPSSVPFISPKQKLKRRLTMILNPQTHSPLAQITTALLALALGITTFTVATAAEEDPAAPSPEAAASGDQPEAKTGPKDGEGAPKTGPKDGDPAAPKPNAAALNTKEGKMFRAYDKDGDGGVSGEEIANMSEGKVSRSDVRKLERLVEELDTDGVKEKLSFEEFKAYLEQRHKTRG